LLLPNCASHEAVGEPLEQLRLPQGSPRIPDLWPRVLRLNRSRSAAEVFLAGHVDLPFASGVSNTMDGAQI
jgi:hypothetical protein